MPTLNRLRRAKKAEPRTTKRSAVIFVKVAGHSVAMRGTNFANMLCGSRRLILAAFVLLPAASFAALNRYDILARILQPYLALFYSSKSGGKALELEAVGCSIAGGNSATYSAVLEPPVKLSFPCPDKLRPGILNPHHRKIVCRNIPRDC